MDDVTGTTYLRKIWPLRVSPRASCDIFMQPSLCTLSFIYLFIYFWYRLPTKTNFEDSLKFVSKWTLSHIDDGDKVLKKPVLFSEYGWSNLNPNFSLSDREKMYKTILDIVYKSAKRNRSGAGALVWQFIIEGLNEHQDDFGMVPWLLPSTYSLFTEQSCRLARVTGWNRQDKNFKELCKQK